MSERFVAQLAQELSITIEQATAVWMKTRQAMYTVLKEGEAVDLGVAYLHPAIRPGRNSYNFGVGAPVMIPAQHTLKIVVPPHVKDALAGKVLLSNYVYMTRRQLKNLPQREKDSLAAQRLDYYRLKGVTG